MISYNMHGTIMPCIVYFIPDCYVFNVFFSSFSLSVYGVCPVFIVEGLGVSHGSLYLLLDLYDG